MTLGKPAFFAVGIATLVATGCSSSASHDEVDAGPPPIPWPTDQWTVKTPEEMGMDPALLEQARQWAFDPVRNTQAVVIVRKRVIVAEWYSQDHDQDSWVASWSVAKSFASTLIGMLIDDGKIPNLDVSMADYYPSWKGTPKEQITLRNVVSFTSGLPWNDVCIPGGDVSPMCQMATTGDELAYAQSRDPEAPPGTKWNYNSGDTMLLSGVVEQAGGMSAGDFARQRIFDKIGMQTVDWWVDTGGHSMTYCCIDSTARQFAKFGLLFLEKGSWDGTRIVSEGWVAQATQPSQNLYQYYGFNWWLPGLEQPELPDDIYAAEGRNDQYIYVVPSLDLVAVRFDTYKKPPGDPIAKPALFTKFNPDGMSPYGTANTIGWDPVKFLKPIIDSVKKP